MGVLVGFSCCTAAVAYAGRLVTLSTTLSNPLVPVQVLGETVDESALAQILLSVLQDESAADDPKAAARGGAAADPPVGEVEAAARFIIKRFGKSTQRVAEEALKEVSSCPAKLTAGALK